MRSIHYGLTSDSLIVERLKNLKKLIEIINKVGSDEEKAVEMRRIYSSYLKFRQAYYTIKNGQGTIPKLVSDYAIYRDEIVLIGSLYKKYEANGLFDAAKEDDKFMVRGNIDARHIISEYILNDKSYDQDLFLSEVKIDKNTFTSCVNRVKTNAPGLYTEYLKKVEINKARRFTCPKTSINNILEGIITGKTGEGKEFNIYEFFRLAPFKNKDFDFEMRKIAESFPEMENFKKLKQSYKNEIMGSGTRTCTYSDNLYLFTWCALNSKAQADILKEYMDDNNIKNITPIYRAATVNCYDETDPTERGIVRSEADELFDIMDREGLPRCYEVFDRLKADMIKKKNNPASIKKTLKNEENN